MFSIVMPIIRFSYLLDKEKTPTSHHDNFLRFFMVGWLSFIEFIEWKDVHTFFVILNKDDKDYFQSLMNIHVPLDLQEKFKIILENDIMKYPIKNKKYSTQMMCKILMANYVKTKHYLVIDDDIIAIRKFGMNDIFVNKITKQIRYTPDKTFNERWWISSAEVLNMLDELDKNNLMSVTPQILITKEVKNLMNYLYTLHGDWEHKLMYMKERWTEYTLYWMYLLKHNKLKLYKKSVIPLSDNSTNIWFNNNNLDESVKRMLQNKKQYFGVIQSNVPEHTYTAVERAIKRLKK